MASKKSGSKAKSGGGAKAGKRKARMEGLKDMEPKRGQKIRGGATSGRADFSNLSIMKVLDKSSAVL